LKACCKHALAFHGRRYTMSTQEAGTRQVVAARPCTYSWLYINDMLSTTISANTLPVQHKITPATVPFNILRQLFAPARCMLKKSSARTICATKRIHARATELHTHGLTGTSSIHLCRCISYVPSHQSSSALPRCHCTLHNRPCDAKGLQAVDPGAAALARLAIVQRQWQAV
jgi:hypothetical protein